MCGRKERLKFLRTGKNLTRAVRHSRGMSRYVVRKAVAKWGNFVCGGVESFVSYFDWESRNCGVWHVCMYKRRMR